MFLFGTLITSLLLWIHMAAYHPEPHLDRAMDAVTVVHTAHGMGTGFFVSSDGCMLTAAHVVTDSSGTIPTVQFLMHGDVHFHQATVIRADRQLDIAYLCADDVDHVHYLQVNDTENVKRGDREYALGHTNGRIWNLTEGVVSRMGYLNHASEVDGQEVPTKRYDMWVTSFISWGNSGGPVVNAYGDVIGMIVEFDDVSQNGAPSGMAVAVPGTDLRRFMRTLRGD